jgi:hypothetical protein
MGSVFLILAHEHQLTFPSTEAPFHRNFFDRPAWNQVEILMGNKLKICNLMRDFASNKIILSQKHDLGILKIQESLMRNKRKCYLFIQRAETNSQAK